MSLTNQIFPSQIRVRTTNLIEKKHGIVYSLQRYYVIVYRSMYSTEQSRHIKLALQIYSLRNVTSSCIIQYIFQPKPRKLSDKGL